jgi:hypothetical protein
MGDLILKNDTDFNKNNLHIMVLLL